jgi:branched-chain amino acid transport system substrate-binding protein
MSPNKAETDHLAHYTFSVMGLRKIVCVYDLSNLAFTEGWYRNFKSEFKNMGGKLTFTATFTSGEEVSYLEMVKNLLNSDLDGLIIIAGALDTAIICQQVRKLGIDVPIVSSGWAFTSDLNQHGGSAVEGLIFSQRYDPKNKSEDYLKFKEQFRERFGNDPNFAAEYSYETARILFEALSKSSDTVAELKSAIINHTFRGLQEDIRIDQYGDTKRKRSLITVKDGQFLTLE